MQGALLGDILANGFRGVVPHLARQPLDSQPVQTPTRGESLHQILERHGTVRTAYTFWLDDHTHSLRHVAVSNEQWWLVFQDGWLECWRAETQVPPFDPQIRNLEWLGHADGLRYLASL